MLAGADRVVLGGQAERVVAHRVQDAAAGAAMEVRDGVADRVDLQVADVRLAARVREHLQHVGLVAASSGSSLETSQVRSSAQTFCQRGSISFGS